MELYFGNLHRRISTLLIFVFIALFTYVMTRHNEITQWGFFVLLMFALGLSMSIFSGVRDGMGKPESLIPVKHNVMTILSLLGGLAFLVGIIALFYHKQEFLELCFYLLSAIIIVKVLVTEGYRLIKHNKQ